MTMNNPTKQTNPLTNILVGALSALHDTAGHAKIGTRATNKRLATSFEAVYGQQLDAHTVAVLSADAPSFEDVLADVLGTLAQRDAVKRLDNRADSADSVDSADSIQ